MYATFILHLCGTRDGSHLDTGGAAAAVINEEFITKRATKFDVWLACPVRFDPLNGVRGAFVNLLEQQEASKIARRLQRGARVGTDKARNSSVCAVPMPFLCPGAACTVLLCGDERLSEVHPKQVPASTGRE